MTSVAYLSPEKSTFDNFVMIAQHNARTTKAHADLLENIRYPKIDYSNWISLAIFVSGFFVGKLISLRSGIGVSSAGICLFLYTQYCIQDPEEQLKIEAEKSKKIYKDLLEMLANFYILKANFVFEKVQKEIKEKNLQDISAIFNTIKQQVDAYDDMTSSTLDFSKREDFLACLFYNLLKLHAIKLISRANEIGPCGEFMELSNFCWEFVYGAGMNRHANWAPQGELKRYFLFMIPSEDQKNWTIQKCQPPILKPF